MGKTVRAVPAHIKKQVVDQRKKRKQVGNTKRGLYVVGEKEN